MPLPLQSLGKMGVSEDFVDPTPSESAAASGLTPLEMEEDKFNQLNEWLLANGANFPLLYMKRYSENYRGVHIRSTVPVRLCGGIYAFS